MAAGSLVPFEVSPGKTIMVPDYLAPKQPGIAMPQAPKPSGPDLRLAMNGTGPAAWGNEIPALPEPTPEERQARSVADIRGALAPQAPTTNEHVTRPAQPAWMPQGAPKSTGAGKVDPSTLARPGQGGATQQQGDAGEEMDPLVRRVFDESLRGGRGGSPGRQVMAIGSQQITREPGKEFLPEYAWANGLSARPDLGQEIDPDAEQPTWGNAEPVYRPVKTSIERGSEASGAAAKAEYLRQVNDQLQIGKARQEQLVGESKALDDQLAVIAQRRDRIAKLQDTADKRMQEAESFEPRTREQIWESKGGAARVLGLLGMAIGGYAQGLGINGGHNPAWEMINKSLDDSVADERSKYERKQKIGMSARKDWQDAVNLYGDLDMAALDNKTRKLASVVALTQQQMNDRSLDANAQARAQMMYAAAQQAYLESKQKLFDQINGKVVKEETTLKPQMVGGSGGAPSTLKAIQNAAAAKTALNTIEGRNGAPTRSVEGDKLNDVNAAMETLSAADSIDRDLDALGANSDIDDPLSGPIDTVARVLGTGGTGRETRQSLARNTQRLARGIQQSLGKSDNDAKLADQMAAGEGDAKSRRAAANIARQQALGRIQTAMAGMTPSQRESFINSLPPERRAQVQAAGSAVAQPRRATSERAVE
jgi:hypothetical protein